MGSGRLLPLTPPEIERILKALGFEFKRARGDHHHWEGTIHAHRRVVTVQQVREELSIGRIKTMIRQSGVTADEFYSADPTIRKRFQGR